MFFDEIFKFFDRFLFAIVIIFLAWMRSEI